MTLAILLIIAIGWGIWMWKRPFQAFAALPFALPTYVIRTSIGPLPTTLLELIVLATFVSWFFRITNNESRSPSEATAKDGITNSIITRLRSLWSNSKPWHLPVGLWLLAGLISIFVSPNHIAAIGLYRAYFIEPILIFIIGLDLMNEEQNAANGIWMKFKNIFDKIFKRKSDIQHYALRPTPYALSSALSSSFALVLILLGLYSIIQMLTGWGIPEPWNFVPGRRAVGFFPFPNALALFVTPIAALLFADLIRGWNQKKEERSWLVSPWLSIPGYLLALVSIILAASDGGLIALGCASFLVLLLNKKTRLFGIGLAIAGIIFIGSIAPLRERVTTVLMFREWSSKVRIVMWQETLMMLKDHKIMGAGLGGYPFVIRIYHKSGNWMEVFQYPHNVILNIWSETGLLGLFAFGWILVRWALGAGRWAQDKTRIPRTTHHVPRTALVLPIIAAMLVHGLVDVPYFKNDLAIIFWLLILVTMEIRTVDNKKT